MEVIIILGLVGFFLFAGVVAFGAPYLPTLPKRVDDAIVLLDLEPGQTFLELGCGDGRLLKAAAKQGIHGVGYELNPLLVLYAKVNTWRYRKLVKVKLANYWQIEWPPSDAMYVFLLQPYMKKLDKKITQYVGKKRYTLVSFAFQIEDRKPTKEKEGMFKYTYNQ